MTRTRMGLAVLALASALAAWFAAGRRGAPPPAPVPPAAASDSPQANRPAPVSPQPTARAPKAPLREERGAGLRDKGEALGGTPPDRNAR